MEMEATGAPQKHHHTLNQQVGSITQPLTVSISIRRITKITHYVLLLLQSVQDSKLACKIPAFLFTQCCD